MIDGFCFSNIFFDNLVCSLCRSPIKHNDLGNLRLNQTDIQAIQLYQQGKLFEYEHASHFNRQRSQQVNGFFLLFEKILI
jgi:hypothetical protein